MILFLGATGHNIHEDKIGITGKLKRNEQWELEREKGLLRMGKVGGGGGGGEKLRSGTSDVIVTDIICHER